MVVAGNFLLNMRTFFKAGVVTVKMYSDIPKERLSKVKKKMLVTY